MKRGRLFILSGPSGVGKGTVRARLFEKIPDLVYSVSCTTRPPREGESEGIQYRFLDEDTFRVFAREGRFLEWANVHGHLYGTLLEDVERQLEKGKSVILEIDVQGALQVKEKVPDSVMIFILPPSFQELEKRLSARGTEAKEAFETRLRNASSEISFSGRYDYSVVNDQVERAATEIAEIIRKEMDR